jgi:hypothetical protein
MIKVRMSHGVAILTFDTPTMQTEPSILLIKGAHLEALLHEIDKRYNQNCRQILINITDVTRIDEEATLGLINRRGKGGIRICFYDMRRSVRNILRDVPALSVAFDIYGSEEVAIASFS